MKILITGAYSTGKTTLVNTLEAELSSSRALSADIVIRADLARQCNLPMNREQDACASAWIAGSMIAAEAEILSYRPRIMICDRGIPDVLSHTPMGAVGVQRSTVEALWEIGKAWAQTYDATFWARPDPAVPVEADGLRVADESYRLQLDSALGEVLAKIDISPIPLPHQLGDRVELIKQVIGALLY